MSIKVMSYVWEHSKQEKSKLLLLLAIADFADEMGFAFPGQDKLAAKCRCTDRYVQKMIADLEVDGELVVYPNMGVRTKYGRTHLYKIVMPGVNDDAIPTSPVIQYEKPQDTTPRQRTSGHKRTKSKANPSSSQKPRRIIVRVAPKTRRTMIRPAFKTETNPGSSNPSVILNPSVNNKPSVKESSPSGESGEGLDIFSLYAPDEDSFMGSDVERSFRSEDTTGSAEEQSGTPEPSGIESLRESGAANGGADILPGRAVGDNDESETDTEEAFPELGNKIVDNHDYRKKFVSRWPAFMALPDSAGKWAQINRMIAFLFEGKGAKKKWAVPFDQPLTLVELYAFNTWMRSKHPHVWEKISNFETVARYVDLFRNSGWSYRREMRSAAQIVYADQNTEPLPKDEPTLSGAEEAALVTQLMGADLVHSKKYDPNKSYIIPARKVNSNVVSESRSN